MHTCPATGEVYACDFQGGGLFALPGGIEGHHIGARTLLQHLLEWLEYVHDSPVVWVGLGFEDNLATSLGSASRDGQGGEDESLQPRLL